MSKLVDQRYLLKEQYNDPSKFNARVALHRRFSTNRHGFLCWAFDQLNLAADACILELGCGPAYLWVDNHDRIPAGWAITLSDFSPGMLAAAKTNLASIDHRFAFEVIDAQAIPFADERFDAVIANHMLYHVPDRERAHAEITRVLRPGGRLFAATNGPDHLRELDQLAQSFDGRLATWNGRPEFSFRLDTGGAELERWFDRVELRRYADGLVVPEAEPLVDFILSMADGDDVDPARRAALHGHIQGLIDADGPIEITKETGMFIVCQSNP